MEFFLQLAEAMESLMLAIGSALVSWSLIKKIQISDR